MVFIKDIRQPVLRELADWVYHISIAVVIALIITNFVFQRTVVNKTSMLPTLHDGDNLLVEKVSTRINKYNRGDIVTVYAPDYVVDEGKTIIKRIIGIEGDEIKIKNGKVYLNDEILEEKYINGNFTRARGKYTELKVEKGYVYVMGDNRADNILDSRVMGLVDINDIKGRAFVRVYPFTEIKVF